MENKIQLLNRLCVFSLFALGCTHILAHNIDYKFSLNVKDAKIESKFESGNSYSHCKFDGLSQYGTVGGPELPVKYLIYCADVLK